MAPLPSAWVLGVLILSSLASARNYKDLPCDKYDGKTIHVYREKYVISCGMDFPFGDGFVTNAPDAAACVSTCALYSGCHAAVYSVSGPASSSCYVKTSINPSPTPNSEIFAAFLKKYVPTETTSTVTSPTTTSPTTPIIKHH